MNGDSGAGVVAATPPTHPPHKERYFDRVDESSAEYQRERNMAPDLRQDFNMMEQRKRVSMILQSPAFCEELETLIHDQMKKGKNPTSLLALQQIADFMTTSVPTMYPAAPQGGMAALNMSLGMVTPVNDLRGSDSIAYEKGEKLLRCKLAAFYRLADLFGWSQLIYNHLTVRLNSEQERFLIVPFGLLYSEVSASSLVKINLQGEIVDRGSTNLGVNQAGFTLHSAIYAARPDIKCIVHIHTPAGAAVSAMKCGLLPISPEALSLGEVAYHDYHGILVDDEEKILIQKNLGPKSKVLILRNHGLVSVGETVEEAFYYIHNLVTACEIQVRTLASAGGPDNLVMLDPGKYKVRPRHPEPAGDGTSPHPKWQVGEQEFEALMRMLDNLGYRTGYPYRCPALRDKAKKYSDVEIPPSATGYSYAEDSDSGARSPLKHSFQRGQRDKTRWLNTGRPDETPDEGLEGSGSPKAKTKVWTNITHDHVKPLLQSLSSGVCVPSCITNCLWTKEESIRQAAVANQFVPLNTNPKEVQEMRNKIREQNLQDIKTAGPQSQVLTGAVVERSFVQRATIWHGELVTASKAIIEKEYQPRVIVTKTGPNPFNKFTDQELEEYRREVELKQKGQEVQVDASGSSVVSVSGGVSTPPASSNHNLEDNQLLAAPSSSAAAAGRSTEPEAGSGRVSPSGPPASLHKDFHCAVLKALSVTTDLSGHDQHEQDSQAEDQPQEPEEVGKGPSPTSTPPSTPIRVEEERHQDQSPKDESDAATLRQTLPDLTPDEPSEAAATVLPAEDPVPSEPDPAPAHVDGEEPVAAEDATGDQGSDESPNKSPSKKKKKFRTPSFLKKNKKKSET
ncbi:alpha-adducin isoform X2 [Pangasianodon hypophthalmus]|uniref:alpha-adducin isoform X2 n=1 Tax=Pangasianodon hypophthalmus TaxID=310915 RepID=UPI00147B4FB8|nr:alpha-adducin isoform X2 [Pangasianodon hypophthalmus]